MRNKLRACFHILMGDSVMYRVSASRHDQIALGRSTDPWWRALFPGHDYAVIECRVWEQMREDWLAMRWDDAKREWVRG